MAIEFKLPDVGEGVAEGEVVQWLVSVGDAVQEHQSVVEVMTDKATVEIPAPASGVITAFQAEAGDVVPVGGVLFILSLLLIPLLPKGFQPPGDPDYLYVNVQGPPGATVEHMEGVVRSINAAFADRPEVTDVFAQIGSTVAAQGPGSLGVIQRMPRTGRFQKTSDNMGKGVRPARKVFEFLFRPGGQ